MNFIKKFLRIILGVMFSVLIGVALMIFVYALPNERAVENIRDALPLYEQEGNYPSWALGEHSKLDNFTDAIMLLEIIHPTDGLIKSAMLNPRFVLPNEEKPVETLIKVLRGDTEGLSETVYPRYWHGYLLVLKPLLLTMKANHLRMLLAYVVFILFVVALLACQKILGTPRALALAATVMILNPVSLSMSFQFAPIYIITMTAIIIMLKKNRRLFDDELYIYFFALTGILIAFFDFLTYPIFSVGMMLIFWYVLNLRGLLKEKLSNVLKMMSELLIAWGTGYFGMWSGKWIISQLLTGYDTVSSAFVQVASYTRIGDNLVNAGWQITTLGAIQRNIAVLGHGPIRIFLFAAIIFLLYVLISRRNILTPRKVLPYLFPATLPFIWYAVASGHSHIHAFFVYRGLASTIFALSCLSIEIWQYDKKVFNS